MGVEARDEAEFQLRKAVVLFSAQAGEDHRWLWEVERWHELAYALMLQLAPSYGEELRQALAILAQTGLLDIGELTSASAESALARRFVETIAERGIDRDTAQHCALVVREAAAGIQNKFAGRVQRYLRKYGDLMVTNLASDLGVASLPVESLRQAGALWLQNVANMPVPMESEQELAFCERVGIDRNTFVDLADDMGINVAFLDDIMLYSVEFDEL